MIFRIRLRARQKQGSSSAILCLCFFILILSAFAANSLPLIYLSLREYILINPQYEKPLSVAFSLLFLIISIWVYSALSLGCDRFMLKRAGDSAAGARDIFYYLRPSRLPDFLFFFLRLRLFKAALFILFLIPCGFCLALLYFALESGFSAMVCLVFAAFSLLFFIFGVYYYFRATTLVFLVRYHYIKGDCLSFQQAISASGEEMHSQRGNLRKMRLSFLGWFLLCIFLLPIPYVWSYYRQTKACFAEELF